MKLLTEVKGNWAKGKNKEEVPFKCLEVERRFGFSERIPLGG
jgi:hypothetical protein